MFGSNKSRHNDPSVLPTRRKQPWYHRKNPNRRAGGLKAALHNPSTSSTGRRDAKLKLRAMGRGNEAHVPLSVRMKHWFGLRGRSSTSRCHARF